MSSLNPAHYLKGLPLDYYTNFSRVHPYFAADYREIKMNPAKISDEVIQSIEVYNKKIKADSAVFENIEKLKEVAPIVTGQQPCLLTGPLYVMYKALTAVILAEQLETVPLFWNASEDDDAAEVNHIWVMNSHLEKIAVELEEMPFSKIVLKREDIDAVINRIKEVTPDTEFRENILSMVQSCGLPFSEMFSQVMSRLFCEFGLIMVEPSIFAESAIPVYQNLIRNPTKAVELVNAAGSSLEKKGYKRQMHKTEDSCSFYILFEDKRHAVTWKESQFKVGSHTYTEKELLTLLDEHPERFTSTVVSRPLVQDFLFSTAAYCAGPGEVSYFAQMKAVYTFFRIEEPYIVPRFGATIIEKKVQKVLDKYGIAITDLDDPDYLLRTLAKKDIPEFFTNGKRDVLATVRELEDYMISVDGNLKKTAAAIRTRIANDLQTLEEKTTSALKSQNRIMETQVTKAAHNIFPNRVLQERVLNVFQYLIRYESLIKHVYQAFQNAQPGEHLLIKPGG